MNLFKEDKDEVWYDTRNSGYYKKTNFVIAYKVIVLIKWVYGDYNIHVIK